MGILSREIIRELSWDSKQFCLSRGPGRRWPGETSDDGSGAWWHRSDDQVVISTSLAWLLLFFLRTQPIFQQFKELQRKMKGVSHWYTQLSRGERPLWNSEMITPVWHNWCVLLSRSIWNCVSGREGQLIQPVHTQMASVPGPGSSSAAALGAYAFYFPNPTLFSSLPLRPQVLIE